VTVSPEIHGEEVARICAACAWQRALGHAWSDDGLPSGRRSGASGPLGRKPRELRPRRHVRRDLAALLRADHREGARSHAGPLAETVTGVAKPFLPG